MHKSNRMFWEHCAEKYRRYFTITRVLEVGSYNINGSVRDYFKEAIEYVGVDWRPGPGVDVVSFAHEMGFDDKFDVVISASMLEHDRHWDKSLTNMVAQVRPDGILMLSCGGARNREHDHDTADDGCFHALPAGRVIRALEEMGVYIHEFVYEGVVFPKDCMNDGMGEVCLVAFKDKKYAIGERRLNDLVPEDRI